MSVRGAFQRQISKKSIRPSSKYIPSINNGSIVLYAASGRMQRHGAQYPCLCFLVLTLPRRLFVLVLVRGGVLCVYISELRRWSWWPGPAWTWDAKHRTRRCVLLVHRERSRPPCGVCLLPARMGAELHRATFSCCLVSSKPQSNGTIYGTPIERALDTPGYGLRP